MPRLAEFATMEPIIRSAAYRESSACAKICAMFTAFVVALLLQASQPAPPSPLFPLKVRATFRVDLRDLSYAAYERGS